VSNQLETFLILVPVFIVSLTLHELAHGWVAYRLGDPTAKSLGRLSLNPIVHMDPLGTAMFAITYWGGGFLFGWAKPVPVDPRYLRNPQVGMAVIAAAGPLTNFVIAALFGAVLAHGTYEGVTYDVLGYAFLVNVVLGVFNLIPIPPLDGSRIVGALMTRNTWIRWSQLDQYGMIAILAIFFVFRDPFSQFMEDATTRVADVIGTFVGGNPLA
jgi:Zn-dependent protease